MPNIFNSRLICKNNPGSCTKCNDCRRKIIKHKYYQSMQNVFNLSVFQSQRFTNVSCFSLWQYLGISGGNVRYL